ncbi:MAG: cupin domain-containing protein [Salinigranum sp.]
MDVTRWDDPAEHDTPYDGAERRLLAYDDTLQLNHNALEEGIEYPVHSHEETVQGMFVVEGEVEIYGDETVRLEEGDSIIIDAGQHHGIRGIAPHSALLVASTPPSGLPSTE